MIGLIIVGIVTVIGVIAFLIGKYVPFFKSNDPKQSKEEIAKENVEKVVVDPEKDIQTKNEHNADLKKQIKKIKQESLTEEEERDLIDSLLILNDINSEYEDKWK